MAGLHQWRKYRVEYEEEWEVRNGTLSSFERDEYFYETSDGNLNVYTGYRVRGGEFELTNPKSCSAIGRNDTVYAFKSGIVSRANRYSDESNGDRSKIYKITLFFPQYFGGGEYMGERNTTWIGSDQMSVDGVLELRRNESGGGPRRGDYIGTVRGNQYAYPYDGEEDGYWYVYDRPLNEAPSISGYDKDLGSKAEDFTINYVVSDSDGDTVYVDILVDDIKKVRDKRTALGVNQKYEIKIGDFNLGDHKVEIRARDSKGAEASSRTYYFSKSNTAPKISGYDGDLGKKSTGFTISYRVEDKDKDPVSVRISLDYKEMAAISNAQGKDLRFTLDDDKVRELEIGKRYTITIKADDGKGGVAYRRYSFTKVNTPPIISGVDSDLGKVKEPVTIKFSVSDIEKDKIYFKLLLDGKEVMSQEGAEDSKEYSYTIDHDRFIRLPYAKHELKLLAWDDNNINNKAVRIFAFERISGGLDVEVKLAEYDTKPKKIVAVPHGEFIDTRVFQVLACNNYLDDKPTWEDITNMSKIARAYSFTNTKKTAGKWALGVRVIIENGQADISSVLRGIKGGIE